MSMPITDAPKADVQLHADIGFTVTFTETGYWCDGKPVITLFVLLIRYIETQILAKLAPFVV
jgi:hypothetical protein